VRIRVLAFGAVRDLLGKAEFDLEVPPEATVLDAVTLIADLAGPAARRLILSPDLRRIRVIVRVDDETAGPDTPLHDGAELKMMHGQH
jgi:molybdopterin converting factor small subunit